MKKLERIEENIVERLNLSTEKVYGVSQVELFIDHANRYIKAIEQGRIICSIGSVSSSGLSRTIKFLECNGSVKNGFNYLNFYQFFKMMGYNTVKNSNYFRINGGGMDMVFNTNYNNIHDLHKLGFISKKKCDKLAQMTPSVV